MIEFLDEILAYVAFDTDDHVRLVALYDVLAPQFPAITDSFFAAARARNDTKAVLANADEAMLREIFVDWMSTGLLGPYDDAFVAKRARIGRKHVEVGLAQHYMITATHVVRRAYHDRVVAAYPVPEVHAIDASVDKLLDLELAVMLFHYHQDADARRLAAERQRRLEQVEALQTLCAGLAHEVRNPLNSAKLQLELAERRIRRGNGDERKLVEPIEHAGHEIDRLTVLLDEFLAFAQPYALDAQPRDVVALVHDVLENDRPLADLRGAELRFVEARGPIIADVDGAKIQQIVESLVANAVEAVAPGGHVSVAVVPLDGHVHIRVTDDGRGIPDSILPRIYEPFFSTKDGGTGMGLSIVHSLVQLHHGSVQVDSSPSGTTFDVMLPRRGRLS